MCGAPARSKPCAFEPKPRWADFGQGNCPTVAVSWGDLVTAFHSTGIPNIEVYFEGHGLSLARLNGGNQLWGWALRDRMLTTWLESLANIIPGGPSEADRLQQRSVIVAEASRGAARARSRLVTPEAYTFSADAAARIAAAVLSGKRNSGFQTPGSLFAAPTSCSICLGSYVKFWSVNRGCYGRQVCNEAWCGVHSTILDPGSQSLVRAIQCSALASSSRPPSVASSRPWQ